MGLGADTRLYLSQGADVVTVDGNGMHLRLARQFYQQNVLNGQLTLMERAIVGDGERCGLVQDKQKLKNTKGVQLGGIASSDEKAMVQSLRGPLPERFGFTEVLSHGFSEESVRGYDLAGGVQKSLRPVTCGDLVRSVGVPEYMKIDVESDSTQCLQSVQLALGRMARDRWELAHSQSQKSMSQLNLPIPQIKLDQMSISPENGTMVLNGTNSPIPIIPPPKYITIEVNNPGGVMTEAEKLAQDPDNTHPDPLRILHSMGYREFKVVRQRINLPNVMVRFIGVKLFHDQAQSSKHVRQVIPLDMYTKQASAAARRNKKDTSYIPIGQLPPPRLHFAVGSGSGLWGEEAVDYRVGKNWRTFEDVLKDDMWKKIASITADWFDIHARWSD